MRLDRRGEAGALKVDGAAGRLVANERLVAWQIDELTLVELLAELAVEVLGIGEADTEGDEGSDVAEDSFAHGGGELGDVLMAQGEIEPVFAGLGQDGGEALRGEVLKLIDEEIEVAPLMLRLAIAGHGGELELRDEQGAE